MVPKQEMQMTHLTLQLIHTPFVEKKRVLLLSGLQLREGRAWAQV